MQAGHGCGQLLNFKTFLPLDRCVHVSVPVWRGGGGGGLTLRGWMLSFEGISLLCFSCSLPLNWRTALRPRRKLSLHSSKGLSWSIPMGTFCPSRATHSVAT